MKSLLINNRFGLVYLLFLVFVATTTGIRALLFSQTISHLDLTFLLLIKIFATGFFLDLVTFTYVSLPFVLYVGLLPHRAYSLPVHRTIVYCTSFVILYLLFFDVVAEYLFFQEFGDRFNFIAVDYLIYTHEVIGNIRESYPVYLILSGICLVSAIVFLIIRKGIDHALTATSPFPARIRIISFFVLGALISLIFVDSSHSRISENAYANTLTANGIYNLFSAFRKNSLDYEKYYATRDTREVFSRLRELLREDNSSFVSDDPYSVTRKIQNAGTAKKWNVVVIVEESMSADYLRSFGNKQGLTPNLDRLAEESLFFDNLYATGTRTVRGLEAVTLSIPPMPGTSVIKRPQNENYFSWGSLMLSWGYDTKFIYGGFGSFDNMNSFFGQNGFSIIDRSDMKSDEITFSNIWGVCDEDLFNRVIREGDRSFEKGRPFFDIVMTTSNHRPFTYPDGRIDIPSHSGRKGGVKYADFALGKFLDDAKKRPWFRDTLFVIVADHCASSAGKNDLPAERYRIPLLIYAPQLVHPRRIDTLASQIDIAPTVLGLLNMSYVSEFFGKDILKMKPADQRAFIATYEKLGFIADGHEIVLGPRKDIRIYELQHGHSALNSKKDTWVHDAVSYYQGIEYLNKTRLHGTAMQLAKGKQ